MRQYGLKKSMSSVGKSRAHKNCSICQPDDPDHGQARARLKILTDREIKENEDD